MSLQSVRVEQPRPEPRSRPERRLQPVSAPHARRKPKLSYAAVAVGGALVIGAAQIAISMASTQDAFVLAQLNGQQHDLTLEKQSLTEQIVGQSSPQALASRADNLGLVVAGSASYLRLSDGAILGAGEGADWASTVNPNGAESVGNVLLTPPASEVESFAESDIETPAGSTAEGTGPVLPPTLTEGLPSPSTR